MVELEEKKITGDLGINGRVRKRMSIIACNGQMAIDRLPRWVCSLTAGGLEMA